MPDPDPPSPMARAEQLRVEFASMRHWGSLSVSRWIAVPVIRATTGKVPGMRMEVWWNGYGNLVEWEWKFGGVGMEIWDGKLMK